MYMKNYDNSINRFHSVKYNILHFSDILYPKFSLFLIIVYDYRPRIRDISCNNAAAMLSLLRDVGNIISRERSCTRRKNIARGFIAAFFLL